MSEKPKMELIGEDGNIFAIMGRASILLRRAGMQKEADEMKSRVFKSESYHDALRIVSEYVDTEISEMTRSGAKKRKAQER